MLKNQGHTGVFKRVYNPHASVAIKEFDNLSRSEVDKIMLKIAKDKKLKKAMQAENRKTSEKSTHDKHERQSHSMITKEIDETTIKVE